MKTLWIILGLGAACFLATTSLMAGEEEMKDGCCKACKKTSSHDRCGCKGCGYTSGCKTSSSHDRCGCGYKCGAKDVDLDHPEGKPEMEKGESRELSYLDAPDPIEREVIQDEMIKATGQEPREEEMDEDEGEEMDFYTEEACKEPEEEAEEEDDEVAQMMPKDMERLDEDFGEMPHQGEEMDPWEREKMRDMKEEKEMFHERKHGIDKEIKLNHIEE